MARCDRMTRRMFAACIVAAAVPGVSGAQKANKEWRVGLVHVGLDHVPPSLEPLRQELRARGYEEGKNLQLDFRNVADERAALMTASNLVRAGTDILVAFEDQAMRSCVSAAAGNVPIVFLHVNDPVADRYVESLARPGKNATGIVLGIVSPAKFVELFAEIIPLPRRLLVLLDPSDPIGQRELPPVREAASAAAVELIIHRASTIAQIERILAGFDRTNADAVLPLYTLRSNLSASLIPLTMQRRLAFISHRKEWVRRGALFSYSPDLAPVGRTAAAYVDQIFKGAKPSDLPVQQATEVELAINLKSARTLGMTIPESVLLRATEVIE